MWCRSLREAARYRFRPIRLRLDGVEHEAASVIVSKGRLYGGRYLLAPGRTPGARGFTVALFERSGPLAALLYGAALPLDLLPRMPGLRLLRAEEVAIEQRRGAGADRWRSRRLHAAAGARRADARSGWWSARRASGVAWRRR